MKRQLMTVALGLVISTPTLAQQNSEGQQQCSISATIVQSLAVPAHNCRSIRQRRVKHPQSHVVRCGRSARRPLFSHTK